MIEFIFQRGEFFYEQPSGVLGVVKDVILPVIMVALGYGLNVFHDRVKHRRRLKHIRENILLEIEALPRILTEQADSFGEFSKEILTPGIKVFGVDIIHNLVAIQKKYDRYSAVDIAESAYVVNRKSERAEIRKRIHNLLEGIRFIDKIMGDSEQLKLGGLDKINEAKGNVNQLIRDLGETIRTYPDLYNKQMKDPFLKEAIEIYNGHLEQQHNATGILFGKRTLIDPLVNTAEVHASKSPKALEMLKPLYECQSVYNRIETQRKFLSVTYKTYAQGLLNVIGSIEAATEVLSEMTHNSKRKEKDG